MRSCLSRLLAASTDGLIANRLLRDVTPVSSTYVIDFSSPNIAKPFHMGNLRSTLIGSFLDRLLRCAGHRVISVNYLGDWGKQFGLLEQGVKTFAPNITWEGGDDLETMRVLKRVYVRANVEAKKLLAQMEKCPSTENLAFWRKSSQLSRRYLRGFYKKLNVNFDIWDGERNYVDKADRLVNQLHSDGIVERNDDGLWLLKSDPDDQDDDPVIMRKSDGTSLYLSRELACVLDRHEKLSADHYLFVVDRAQARHFDRLKRVLVRIDQRSLSDRIVHVQYGRIHGLTTRRTDDDDDDDDVDRLFDRGSDLARQSVRTSATVKVAGAQLDHVVDVLARSVVVVDCLRRQRRTEYRFCFDDISLSDGDSGTFLQQKHARLCGIERVNLGIHPDFAHKWTSLPLDTSEANERLLAILLRYESTLMDCLTNIETCPLVGYAFELARESGRAAKVLLVRGQSEHKAVPRLTVLSVARRVLADCLLLLGLEPLVRM